ncbi:mechanosensitive ion channel protein MscS [Paenibacillus sp. 32O-W]|jgi:Small-conductance mechanosensitive channel|uniref:Mechanosensitive ion channel protein MscS n=1 Tax=Paenibacillus cisolokensis TaxID=1658519 RepID=A0ABQ4N777_9BACL|nr:MULTISPECIES: mechanosensitive ion channel family protein [Paenibacillus]ALS25802.1 mechanosensitive ion channel protein MscS [Paenibacillus sp. 32O-W]GIQ64025.1 mechanosensitive ion channel protein MscS [Paenibacillus cisolokensis]
MRKIFEVDNSEAVTEVIEDAYNWVVNPDVWRDIGIGAIRILLIIAFGQLVIWIIHKAIDRFLERDTKRLPLRMRRVQTVGRLLKNIASYVLYFVIGMLVLSEFNINLGPLLAGAGVLGLAIGFGAQSLVKDVIAGFFIILEDQFAVGDVIETGKFKGTVEVIGLRATRIQSWTGEVHIIPNGMISDVTNFSLNNSLAVIDIPIPHEENIERTTEAINHTLSQLKEPNLVRTPELIGIQSLNASEVVLRIVAECRPNTQAAVTRAINIALKKALDERRMEKDNG